VDFLRLMPQKSRFMGCFGCLQGIFLHEAQQAAVIMTAI
jgi:hypothetical protein